MARFVFQYETLLRHRRNIEDARKRELGALVGQRVKLENELRQMQQTISRSKHDLGGSLVGDVDLMRVADFARYSGQVTLRAQGLVRQIAALEGHFQAARDRLAAARRDRRALELLRDRRLEAWKRRQELREAAELDDLTTGAYARQSMEAET